MQRQHSAKTYYWCWYCWRSPVLDSTQQSPGSGVCKKTIMTMVATLMVATLLVMAVKGYQFVFRRNTQREELPTCKNGSNCRDLPGKIKCFSFSKYLPKKLKSIFILKKRLPVRLFLTWSFIFQSCQICAIYYFSCSGSKTVFGMQIHQMPHVSTPCSLRSDDMIHIMNNYKHVGAERV